MWAHSPNDHNYSRTAAKYKRCSRRISEFRQPSCFSYNNNTRVFLLAQISVGENLLSYETIKRIQRLDRYCATWLAFSRIFHWTVRRSALKRPQKLIVKCSKNAAPSVTQKFVFSVLIKKMEKQGVEIASKLENSHKRCISVCALSAEKILKQH